mgnify:CR=1 FL=1
MKTGPAYEEVSVRLFARAGSVDTPAVLEAAARRAAALNIRRVLVATCSGRTALAAAKTFGPDVRIIAVTHVTGFSKPNHQELTAANRRKLEEAGIPILTAQHAFGGVGRGIRNRLGAYQVDEIIAFTLRTFGQGTKVAVEISLMAADAGLVRTDEDVIAIGGTVSGCDTALRLRPANSAHVLDLKVREIICKPADF